MDRIYGEKEAGGTSVLYLSAVPFEKLNFPEVGNKPFPVYSKVALGMVPPAVMALGATLAMAYSYFRKRVAAVAGHAEEPHPEFERVPNKLLTR